MCQCAFSLVHIPLFIHHIVWQWVDLVTQFQRLLFRSVPAVRISCSWSITELVVHATLQSLVILSLWHSKRHSSGFCWCSPSRSCWIILIVILDAVIIVESVVQLAVFIFTVVFDRFIIVLFAFHVVVLIFLVVVVIAIVFVVIVVLFIYIVIFDVVFVSVVSATVSLVDSVVFIPFISSKFVIHSFLVGVVVVDCCGPCICCTCWSSLSNCANLGSWP